jgi:hypothetical protein
MKRSTVVSIHAGAFFMALSLAGCGGGGDSDRRSILASACSNGNQSACSQLASMPELATGTKTPTTTTSGTGTGTTGITTTPTIPTPTPGITLNPKALTLGDCTTNIPFFFSGGTPPYTILTTDNFKIPVSSAQRLGSGSEYFFLASVGPLIGRSPVLDPTTKELTYTFTKDYPPATLTVLDSQQRAATATLTFPVIHLDCHDNPLLQTSPASANAHETEILAFQVTGGDGASEAVSNDENVAVIINPTANPFQVKAVGVGTTLITVTSSDGQKANIVFTVLPLQK